MRRLLAWTVDVLPCLVALFFASPALLALFIQADEGRRGVGLFDPATGGDPGIDAHLARQRPVALAALVLAASWLCFEIVAALRGGSVGQRWLGIAPPGPSTTRRLLRATGASVLTVVVVAAAFAATRPTARRPGYELYLPRSEPKN